jgi:hypothetical protein
MFRLSKCFLCLGQNLGGSRGGRSKSQSKYWLNKLSESRTYNSIEFLWGMLQLHAYTKNTSR